MKFQYNWKNSIALSRLDLLCHHTSETFWPAWYHYWTLAYTLRAASYKNAPRRIFIHTKFL